MDLVNIKLRPMSELELESESKPMQRRLNGAGHRRAWMKKKSGKMRSKNATSSSERGNKRKTAK